jgi:hypothetical protein
VTVTVKFWLRIHSNASSIRYFENFLFNNSVHLFGIKFSADSFKSLAIKLAVQQ